MDKYKNKPKNIDAYIRKFPRNSAGMLRAIRKIVNEVAPDAKEVISYGMPAFKLNGIIIYFAGFEHHIGMYPMSSALRAFKKDLSKYKTGKGSIRFPIGKPLPLSLIRKIVKYRVKENLGKEK